MVTISAISEMQWSQISFNFARQTGNYSLDTLELKLKICNNEEQYMNPPKSWWTSSCSNIPNMNGSLHQTTEGCRIPQYLTTLEKKHWLNMCEEQVHVYTYHDSWSM